MKFRVLRLLLGLTLPVFLLDQGTKWAVLWNIEYGAEIPVIPGFFSLVYWSNTGAAFSFMSDSNGFFIGLSAVAVVVLCVLAALGKFKGRVAGTAWALLFGGILGNLTDRILHGAVVDFLLFNLHVPHADPWPAFNVADSCIFIAAALFIWESFQDQEKTEAK